ncbi:MAG: site-2 protease family protein [Candidatus Aenigmatarchaeota archaeon]
MTDWYMVSVLVFAAFLSVVVYLDRKRWKRESILLLRKTQKGKAFLIWLGNRFPRFWLALGTFAVIITLVSSVWIFLLLIVNTHLLATGKTDLGPGILLPSPTNKAFIGPGYLAVPFWYWIISIAVLVIAHEGMHGVMAAREKVRIKSLGWGLLAVIPLAFVEPDEKQLKRQKPWKQLRVFAAGSFANFAVAFCSLAVLAIIAVAFFVPAGVGYTALIKDYPAEKANMTGTIISINGEPVNSRKDLSEILLKTGPNKNITITTTNGTHNFTYVIETIPEPEPEFRPDFSSSAVIWLEHIFPGAIDFSKSVSEGLAYITGNQKQRSWSSIKEEISFWEYVKSNYPALTDKADSKISNLEKELQSHPRSGFIGIIADVYDYSKIKQGLENYEGAFVFLKGLMFFLFFINFGVGLFNMLPIGPLDGGRMWGIILKRFAPEHSKKIMNYLTILIVAILALDFILVLT